MIEFISFEIDEFAVFRSIIHFFFKRKNFGNNLRFSFIKCDEIINFHYKFVQYLTNN